MLKTMTLLEISPQEALNRVQAGALLVDVREPHEYNEVRAVGAQLIPLSNFGDMYNTLPQNRELVIICRSGVRSARAAEFLLEQGYQAINLAGGTLAWVEAELPVERG